MYTNRHIWHISYPIFLSLLAQNIINVTDTAFLGRVGEVELGASAMGGLYYICMYTIAFGFSIGSQIVIGRRNGEKNYKAIGPVVIQGIFFVMVLALTLFLFSRFVAADMMRALITSDNIWTATMEFLDLRVYGFFFSFLNAMFRALFVGITRTKVLTLNALLMAIVNVIFDYLLIFGHAGFPRMGIQGAAIASLIAEGTSILFFVIYTYLTVDRKKYGLNQFSFIDWSLLQQVLKISIFTMLQYFLSMGTFLLFFVVVERLGERELAVANIVRSIYILMFIPVNSLSTTTNTLVSNTMGAGKTSFVFPLIRKIACFSLGIMIPFSIGLCLFPYSILSIYTNDFSLIQDSVLSVYVIAIVGIFCSITSVVFSGLSGTGNTRPALILEMLILILYVIFIYIIGIKLSQPVHICFISEWIYYVGLLGGCVVYFRFASWDKKKI